MNEPWYLKVMAGDLVYPIPMWNRTERPPNHLHSPTEVLGIRRGQSQTGVQFSVRTKGGEIRRLDAGWFEPEARGRS